MTPSSVHTYVSDGTGGLEGAGGGMEREAGGGEVLEESHPSHTAHHAAYATLYSSHVVANENVDRALSATLSQPSGTIPQEAGSY